MFTPQGMSLPEDRTGLPPLTEPRHCKLCDGWYVSPKSYKVSCAVAHAPGTCCHYGDWSVDQPDHIRDYGVL